MKVRDAIKLIEQDGWTSSEREEITGSTRTRRSPTSGAEMRYAVIIEKTETGYSAYVPDLPGCVSVGCTRAEMGRNIREAIALYLDELRKQGAPIPAPATDTAYIAV